LPRLPPTSTLFPYTTLFRSGVERFKQQDYEAARLAFARAYELAPQTGTLLNLALAELQAGKALIAVKHFRQFLRAPDATPDKIRSEEHTSELQSRFDLVCRL